MADVSASLRSTGIFEHNSSAALSRCPLRAGSLLEAGLTPDQLLAIYPETPVTFCFSEAMLRFPV